MYHTREDERRLFKRIEETSRRLDNEIRIENNKKFNNLMKKRGDNMKASKTFYIDENKSLYVIICANCGYINKYYKIIKGELCHCKKCGVRINPPNNKGNNNE